MIKRDYLTIVATAVMAVACSTDGLIEQQPAQQVEKNTAIGFNVRQSNMTRATTSLQAAKHYNFGVFGYKSTDATYDIMANYLVGYNGQNEKVGYYMETSDQTTFGDAASVQNGLSPWQYERLGYQEYIYTGGEGYYTKDQTKYMSNVDFQYLRFWDLSAANTTFYAYAPYLKGTTSVTYDNNTHIMTFPDNAMVAGYDNPTDCEYLYAATQVAKADYGKDVTLSFKHANAKVNIKFWEDLDGYSVRVIDLGGSTSLEGVQAAPAIRQGSASPYTYTKIGAEYFEKQGFTVDFTTPAAPTLAWATGTKTSEPLKFAVPADEFIGTTRLEASASATTYYAIPKDNTTGFTFHVSYELTSNTGEKITIHNATAHVPAADVNWDANKAYTYYFRITRGTNGTTDAPGAIDPTDPNVPDTPALFPIIFDNCTVEDYEAAESDHNLTDDTTLQNYSLQLDNAQVVLSSTIQQVTPSLLLNGTVQSSPAGDWSVTYPTDMTDDGSVAYNPSTKVFEVKPEAKTGVYTIVYTPDPSEKAPNATYSTTLTVIGTKTVGVSTTTIGTGGMEATTLTFTVKNSGAAFEPATGSMSIVYPATLTEDQKSRVQIKEDNKVEVANNAIGGTYYVKYHDAQGDVQTAFVVKQYTFTLSTSEVNHNNTAQDITITLEDGVTNGTLSLEGTPAGITLDATNKKITVAASTAAGTYTVYYEVNNSESKTKYKRTFTVKNVYVLSLDKTNVNLSGTDADRTIHITASKNAVNETGVTNLKLLAPDLSEVTAFKSLTGLSYVVPTDAQVGTYKILYEDGGTTVKGAEFVVKNVH